MAKIRRNAARPARAKTARSSGPARKTQARPAVRTTARSMAKPAKSARPVARPVATHAAKPAARSAAKPLKTPVKGVLPGPAKPSGKPVKAVAPPPHRSTYADAVSLYERGMQALQAKRYREASETLKAVIARFPEEKELHERAQLYIRVCERQLTPLDSTPKTPEEQVYAATLAINSGQVDRAIALLSAALQRDSENDPAEYMLGVAFSLKGDVGAALVHIKRALELNPDNRELVRKEPDLDAVRQTEDIRAILAAPPELPKREKRPAPRRR
jgi:tetratricopeptide (TPR) repeat protein